MKRLVGWLFVVPALVLGLAALATGAYLVQVFPSILPTEGNRILLAFYWFSGVIEIAALGIFLLALGLAIRLRTIRSKYVAFFGWLACAVWTYVLALSLLSAYKDAYLAPFEEPVGGYTFADFAPLYVVPMILFTILFGPAWYYWLRILKRST